MPAVGLQSRTYSRWVDKGEGQHDAHWHLLTLSLGINIAFCLYSLLLLSSIIAITLEILTIIPYYCRVSLFDLLIYNILFVAFYWRFE